MINKIRKGKLHYTKLQSMIRRCAVQRQFTDGHTNSVVTAGATTRDLFLRSKLVPIKGTNKLHIIPKNNSVGKTLCKPSTITEEMRNMFTVSLILSTHV